MTISVTPPTTTGKTAAGSIAARNADLLVQAISSKGSPVCVGLDPALEQLPEATRRDDPVEAIEMFSRGVIDAVAPHVPAIKFQSACYERHGWRGMRVLESCMHHARNLGLVVVLDAKRGDIGISSNHYAAAAAGAGAHFVTVNGYLGLSGVEPFLNAGLGVFVLVRTSNPDSAAVQSEKLASGATVAEHMAGLVHTLGVAHIGAAGLSAVGAVVGATQSREAGALRALMPDQIFLIPGYGAQGGTADDIRVMRRASQPPEKSGVLVTASRSVIYAKATEGQHWLEAVGTAAKNLAHEIRDVVG
ncbi:MAG: orotidine-5'-phosphate decarboxylase [Phycisphaerales bacterium]|nr:orotidine-5'-phosphate decarboxylase [Phycisphaerales bacterium]